MSFWLLALVLKHFTVGTTYAIWSAAGTAAIALIGIPLRRARRRAQGRVARLLIILGVSGLNAAGAH